MGISARVAAGRDPTRPKTARPLWSLQSTIVSSHSQSEWPGEDVSGIRRRHRHDDEFAELGIERSAEPGQRPKLCLIDLPVRIDVIGDVEPYDFAHQAFVALFHKLQHLSLAPFECDW